uniref:Uncharacterized protein n=1 Tax=Ditylenchus dipsaci TaxID=166011 RepID=A0A915D2G8_9BILA
MIIPAEVQLTHDGHQFLRYDSRASEPDTAYPMDKNLDLEFLKPSGFVPVPMKEDFYIEMIEQYKQASKEKSDKQTKGSEGALFIKPNVEVELLKPDRDNIPVPLKEDFYTQYFDTGASAAAASRKNDDDADQP